MLIMQEITILKDQPLGMCLSWVREQFLGVAKDNQQYHYQLQKQSIEQQLENLKNVRGWNSWWKICTRELTIQYNFIAATNLRFA